MVSDKELVALTFIKRYSEIRYSQTFYNDQTIIITEQSEIRKHIDSITKRYFNHDPDFDSEYVEPFTVCFEVTGKEQRAIAVPVGSTLFWLYELYYDDEPEKLFGIFLLTFNDINEDMRDYFYTLAWEDVDDGFCALLDRQTLFMLIGKNNQSTTLTDFVNACNDTDN